MSKAILLSIKPKYVADILNGKKTIEIRKQILKCKLPIDVYIYCTQKPGYLTKEKWKIDWIGYIKTKKELLNGKVVAKFKLKKIEKIQVGFDEDSWEHYYFIRDKELTEKACVSNNELNNYLQGNNGYAWFIDDLKVFANPKELTSKAPQSYCYIDK